MRRVVTTLCSVLLVLLGGVGCADDASETGLFITLLDDGAGLGAPDDFDALGLQVLTGGAVRLGLREPVADGLRFPQSVTLLAGPVRGPVEILAVLFRGSATVAQGSAEATITSGKLREVTVVLATGALRTCEDLDADGYGNGAGCLGPDCDDLAAGRNPGVVEVCDNGVDDDCDGAEDEGCGCPAGESRACNAELDGVGECRAGMQTCTGGAWSECAGGRAPGREVCNGLDDDCDGATDEGFDFAADPENCGGCGEVCRRGEVCLDRICTDQGCPSGTLDCGGGCVDPDTSTLHCGGCDAPCALGARCVRGECACPAGQEICDGRCVDTWTDPLHCGGCDRPCAAHLACVGGECACPEGLTECGEVCLDTDSDPENCGGCDRRCAEDQVCFGGECGGECPPGTTACDGGCVDTTSNPEHCGECNHGCGSGQVCEKSRCACPAGETECGGVCVDTDTSSQHCGRCDRPCSGGQACQGGECACPAGQTDCGACVDTTTSNDHCGRCDNPCTGDLTCQSGECRCPGSSLVACGDACVDTSSDPEHCGGCDRPCTREQECVDYQCRCSDGRTDCGGECVDTTTSNDHCGRCDNPCTGDLTCQGDDCGCDGGLAACGTACVDTDTSLDHCGRCDRPCGAGQTCEGGECRCDGGLTGCGEDCVDTDTSLDHCGQCDRPCAPANAIGAVCSGGGCSFTDCSPDHYDQNEDPWDGCEVYCSPSNPGAEVCGDGEDNDCDGSLICDGGTVDADGDEYGDEATGGTDCDDTTASVHPGAAEVCGDGIDQDCQDGDLECPSGQVLIAAGSFTMGSDYGEGESDEEPERTVTLDAYYIDVTEVTNAAYAECVAAAVCTAPVSTSSATRGSYYGSATYADHPVIHVTWYQARRYCEWRGGRLPSEAEWERAARGPTPSERTFPWGEDEPACDRTNFGGPDGSSPCLGDTDAVATRPLGATPEGLHDMAGNVYEWVHDWYGTDYYSVGETDNPLGPDEPDLWTDYRSRRGGSWASETLFIRAANRAGADLDSAEDNLGFRCARSHPDADHDRDGESPAEGDCDDADPERFSGATEICGDGIDNDCDGSVICDGGTVDADGDEYGSVSSGGTDCHDDTTTAHPGLDEVCNDGYDNDCNGEQDEANADGCDTYYYDGDGDGYGEDGDWRCLCGPEDPYDVTLDGDCADGDAARNPGETEICGDGIDQDCSGADLPCVEDMVEIPAGEFVRGSTASEAGDDEDPVTTVYLDAFQIDTFPVTNEDYATCVSDGGCTAPMSASCCDTISDYYTSPVHANSPVVNVTWYQAEDYCLWAGKRLLTEAEWERAASGPGPGKRKYPWGSATPDCTRANYGTGGPGDEECVGHPSPVDAHPAGATPDGVWDLAGNVYEWVADHFGASYYSDPSSLTNPQGPASADTSTGRVRRGAAWEYWSTPDYLRSANRAYRAPGEHEDYIGFRCGKDPD